MKKIVRDSSSMGKLKLMHKRMDEAPQLAENLTEKGNQVISQWKKLDSE